MNSQKALIEAREEIAKLNKESKELADLVEINHLKIEELNKNIEALHETNESLRISLSSEIEKRGTLNFELMPGYNGQGMN